jgi:hypothetical protein
VNSRAVPVVQARTAARLQRHVDGDVDGDRNGMTSRRPDVHAPWPPDDLSTTTSLVSTTLPFRQRALTANAFNGTAALSGAGSS